MTRAQSRNEAAARRFRNERIITPRMVIAGERHELYPHRGEDFASKFYVRPAVHPDLLKPQPAIDVDRWRVLSTVMRLWLSNVRMPSARLLADVACWAAIGAAVIWIGVAIVRAQAAGTL